MSTVDERQKKTTTITRHETKTHQRRTTMHTTKKLMVVLSTFALLAIGGEATARAQGVTVTKEAGSPGSVVGKTIRIYPNYANYPRGVFWKDAWIVLSVKPGGTNVSAPGFKVWVNGRKVVLARSPAKTEATYQVTIGGDTYTVIVMPNRCLPAVAGRRVKRTCVTSRGGTRRSRCPSSCLKEIDDVHQRLRKLRRQHEDDIDAINRKLTIMKRELAEAKDEAKRGVAGAERRIGRIQEAINDQETRIKANKLPKGIDQPVTGGAKGSKNFDWNLYGGAALKVFGNGRGVGYGPFLQLSLMWSVNDARSIYLGVTLRGTGVFQDYRLLSGGLSFDDPDVGVQLWTAALAFHFEWRANRFFGLNFNVGMATVTEYHDGRVTLWPNAVKERNYTYPGLYLSFGLRFNIHGFIIMPGIAYEQPFMRHLRRPSGLAGQGASENFLGNLYLYLAIGF